jgi:diguanylate cyclase (GGDEF)-like protein/PAS domain S-box-containing protein
MKETFYENLLENLFDGVYFVDLDRQITYWNKAAEKITGYLKSEVIGSGCANHILRHIDYDGKELCLGDCPLRATLKDGKPREANVYLHHKLGHRVPVSVRISPIMDDAGKVVGAVEIFSDITDHQSILREVETLRQAAYIDELTRVGNRRFGEMTLQAKLYELQTFALSFGILFIDIDHFKVVNDDFGHQTGDEVLTMVGRTLANILRKVDAVIRWGGEEFVVILPNIHLDTLQESAERVRVFIERSFIMVNDQKLAVTVSVGASMAKNDDTVESVLQRVDELMYQSKQQGRNRVTVG